MTWRGRTECRPAHGRWISCRTDASSIHEPRREGFWRTSGWGEGLHRCRDLRTNGFPLTPCNGAHGSVERALTPSTGVERAVTHPSRDRLVERPRRDRQSCRTSPDEIQPSQRSVGDAAPAQCLHRRQPTRRTFLLLLSLDSPAGDRELGRSCLQVLRVTSEGRQRTPRDPSRLSLFVFSGWVVMVTRREVTWGAVALVSSKRYSIAR